jgi:hypothetical protein
VGLAVGLLVMPVAVALGIDSAGAGHGNYLAAKVLFPFTMLSTFVLGSITLPFVLLGIAQFPVYGWLVGQSARHKRWFGVVTVAVAHLLAATINIAVRNPSF